jgi:hypothetical protein
MDPPRLISVHRRLQHDVALVWKQIDLGNQLSEGRFSLTIESVAPNALTRVDQPHP